MDIQLLSLCLLCGLAVRPCALSTSYRYVSTWMTWAQAQEYCRMQYTDLATIGSEDDLNRIGLSTRYEAWIGLHDDPASWFRVMSSDSNSWRWSVTGSTSPGGYQNWEDSEPNKADGAESCVALNAKGMWADMLCTNRYDCLCYTVQKGIKQFILLSDKKMSWNDCQTTCREKHRDLAMIESKAENQAAQAAVGRDLAWIGLYRDLWSWSDLSPSRFRKWQSHQPDNSKSNQHCVYINANKQWFDESCSEKKLYSICEQVPSPCAAVTPDPTTSNSNSVHFNCPSQKLVLVKELLSWEQALDHCRNLGSYRLLSVDLNDMEAIKFVLRFATSNKVWLSLRFLAGSWFWADGAPLSLPSLPSCPGSLHCGALLRNGTSIEPTDCRQKHNLLCYQELPSKD